MSSTDPLWSNWNSDDDEELLLDVWGPSATSSKSLGARPHLNACLGLRVNPENLPEHLKPLMKGLVGGSYCKREVGISSSHL